ncbi:MAG: histone deacetylase family protein [Burkholderiales bacterium]|jgi:acetoin utilization deacetylase AcuC-like enzyme|nr:histone deacetylase family protein [Burkholderiales bacterium]
MHTGFITHRACLAHEMGSWHPEAPSRLTAIHDHLIAVGLLPHLVHIDAPVVAREALWRAHDRGYIEHLESRIPKQGYVSVDPDTAMNPATWDAALRSAGAVTEAVDQVMAGQLENAFCAVRPPGHHARPAHAMGFCFFNNVAVGARHAMQVHGLRRVAVIDFDVHHGNGTEEILANDERALMVSFFQHPFYPYTGAEHPAKNMVNVPLPAGSRGDVVRQVVDEQWIPALDAFCPQLVLISAGFDAHREDDLGQMGLVEADYAYITKRLMEVADRHAQGRVVSTLEGGYNLSALARSVAAHVKTLAQL